MTPRLKKINWNDAEPVKGKLTVSTQRLNLEDFENQNLASSFEKLTNFSKEHKERFRGKWKLLHDENNSDKLTHRSIFCVPTFCI